MVPVMFWEVLITRWRAFSPGPTMNHVFVMFPVRMLSIAPLWKSYIFVGSTALFVLYLTTMEMYDD